MIHSLKSCPQKKSGRIPCPWLVACSCLFPECSCLATLLQTCCCEAVSIVVISVCLIAFYTSVGDTKALLLAALRVQVGDTGRADARRQAPTTSQMSKCISPCISVMNQSPGFNKKEHYFFILLSRKSVILMISSSL